MHFIIHLDRFYQTKILILYLMECGDQVKVLEFSLHPDPSSSSSLCFFFFFSFFLCYDQSYPGSLCQSSWVFCCSHTRCRNLDFYHLQSRWSLCWCCILSISQQDCFAPNLLCSKEVQIYTSFYLKYEVNGASLWFVLTDLSNPGTHPDILSLWTGCSRYYL